MSTTDSAMRPLWTRMRPEDFDATVAPTLCDEPSAPLSDGADLLALLP